MSYSGQLTLEKYDGDLDLWEGEEFPDVVLEDDHTEVLVHIIFVIGILRRHSSGAASPEQHASVN